MTRETLRRAETGQAEWCAAEILRAEGVNVLRRAGPDSADRAEALLERSLDIARQQQARSWGLRAAVSLGRLRLAQGRRDAARQLLEPALAAFTESFATAELKAAKALLSEL